MRMRWEWSTRSAAGLAIVLAAGILAMPGAQASQSPRSVPGGIAGSSASGSTSAVTELTGPCRFKEKVVDCQSINRQTDTYLYYHGDVSGCVFSWQIDWGDGKTQTVVQAGPQDGWVYLARHSYNPKDQKTYNFSEVGTVTSGSCTTVNGHEIFELLSYVALGDSYSSGTGAGGYLHGTGFSFQDGGNECLRSANAYAALTAKYFGNPAPNRGRSGTFIFDACNGAEINDFSHRQLTDDKRRVPSQLSDLARAPGSVGLVTLTIGGNDARFAAVMNYCAKRTKKDKSCKDRWQKTVNGVLAAIEPRLVKLYTAIQGSAALATGAKVLVLGYPRFFPAQQSKECPTGDPFHHFLVSDMRWINTEIQYLDAKIKDAAKAAGISYVNDYGALRNHELCDKDPYLNYVVFVPLAAKFVESYHPKAKGHEAFAKMVEVVLKRIAA
jgi:lysophospholipase L1-like esterase